MVKILDGRRVADSLLEEVKKDVDKLKQRGILPKLVVVMLGENPASAVYVKHKEKACEKVGIIFEKMTFPENVTQEKLLNTIVELNEDATVHGLIVQLPLPKHIDVAVITRAILPYKDVDGFSAYNLGETLISKEFEDMSPCTPKGITKILDFYDIDVSGMEVVVVGRSNIVGKPIAMMLLNRNATVTVCHRRTKDLAAHTLKADMIVMAVGKAKMLTADMVKEGAIVIDVGINRLKNGKLCGDADFESLEQKIDSITPVPRGVGPMTVACLMGNTVTAAKKQNLK